jgi:hypothetical protein
MRLLAAGERQQRDGRGEAGATPEEGAGRKAADAAVKQPG